jgi:Domain found in Dishevelled, Egl-10, and Pleckstrin (DEP)
MTAIALSILVVVLSTIVLLRRLRWKIQRFTKADRGAHPASKQSHPAILRIPLSSVSLVGPLGRRAALSKVAFLGRMDGTFVAISVDTLSCSGGEHEQTPFAASAYGVRVSLNNGAILANIDAISELCFPNAFSLAQPLRSTVVRYDKGQMTLKMNTLSIVKLPRKGQKESEDDGAADPFTELGQMLSSCVEDTRQVINRGGRQVNEVQKRVRTGIAAFGGLLQRQLSNNQSEMESKEMIQAESSRARINTELYSRVMTMRTLAELLESIPLGRHRHRLRLYPDSFRGSDAVDFLLEHSIVDNRVQGRRILRDLQIQFCLFEHVTGEYKYRDDHDSIFRFVVQNKRRMWSKTTIPFTFSEKDESDRGNPILPLPITMIVKELIVRRKIDENPFFSVGCAEVRAEPCLAAHAIEVNAFFGSLETSMLKVSNFRVRCVVDPDLSNELHGLELSVDDLRASPVYTAEDWYEKLGFVKQVEGGKKRDRKVPSALPFIYIAPFKLRFSLDGIIVDTNEMSVNIESFSGNDCSTSNDLINHFVMHILTATPGLLANFRFMGINVLEKSGIISALTVGTSALPFGQYMAIGGIALFDGVTGALDKGKQARNDPNGPFKLGDFARGVLFSAKEAARHGAFQRGKILEQSSYEEGDEVQLDPLDFALGASHGTAAYVYKNKARFIGATVAASSVVALTVATGPVFGMLIGVVCGIAAEKAIKKAEKVFEHERSDDAPGDL